MEEKPKKTRKKSEKKQVSPKVMIAKRDFLIMQNDYKRVIKKGEEISDVPAKFHENLKTEGII